MVPQGRQTEVEDALHSTVRAKLSNNGDVLARTGHSEAALFVVLHFKSCDFHGVIVQSRKQLREPMSPRRNTHTSVNYPILHDFARSFPRSGRGCMDYSATVPV